MLVDGQWKQILPPLGVPRHSACAVCIDSVLYVFGGASIEFFGLSNLFISLLYGLRGPAF